MKIQRITGFRLVGAVALIAGGLWLNAGTGVPSAAAQNAPGGPPIQSNPTLRWDSNNPSDSRFLTAFPGAVLDKNTGVVFEAVVDGAAGTWAEAALHCINKNIDGLGGWHLPDVATLRSVQDHRLPVPFVPANVFSNIQRVLPYWTSTTNAADATKAWAVDFFSGRATPILPKSSPLLIWCVRGPSQLSVY